MREERFPGVSRYWVTCPFLSRSVEGQWGKGPGWETSASTQEGGRATQDPGSSSHLVLVKALVLALPCHPHDACPRKARPSL